MKLSKLLLAATAVSALTAGSALARDQIKIVGSSTVFPFSTAVAEQFGKTTDFETPSVESTGSGGGIKLFCEGIGANTPDITNASRRMKPSELELCQGNGVTDVVEAVVGYDGIVIANSADAPQYNMTLDQVYTALAAQVPNEDGELVDNPNQTWSDIDPSFPNVNIEVFGPPPTSGTRDAFEELALEAGCEEAGLDDSICGDITVRTDGAYIESGENDNGIVSQLQANPNALGVFGFSFLDQNLDKLQGAQINSENPTFENIANGAYPLSRSLYFYVKAAHVDVIPGITEYVQEFVSENAIGESGYLVEKGLIPLQGDAYAANRARIDSMSILTGDVLKK